MTHNRIAARCVVGCGLRRNLIDEVDGGQVCNHPDLLRKSAGKEVALEDALAQLFGAAHSVGAPMHSGRWIVAVYFGSALHWSHSDWIHSPNLCVAGCLEALHRSKPLEKDLQQQLY